MIVYKKVLGPQWPTQDPFIFLVHHQDHYPQGNEQLGPQEAPTGKLGNDFDNAKPWRMYHGTAVPGFPVHPHRGFETVTIVQDGIVDHFDSSGGTGRYGAGDIQWMTAGAGIQHAEMFPLLDTTGGNKLQLFQIWLNLPAKDKFATPYYKMLWREQVPEVQLGASRVRVIAGDLGPVCAPAAPPDSWATKSQSRLRILTIRLEEGQWLYLKSESRTVLRSLYHYQGDELCLRRLTPTEVEGLSLGEEGLYAIPEKPLKVLDCRGAKHLCALLPSGQMAALSCVDLLLWAEGAAVDLLYLAAEPIAEPMAQYGPFVMNTRAEIQKAFWDYENTHFGGWPWKRSDPVHPRDYARQARYGDGAVSWPEVLPKEAL